MKDFFESVISIVEKHTSYLIPIELMPYLIVAAIGISALFSVYPLYLAIRRVLGDARAISSELGATAQLINQDTRQNLKATADQINGETLHKLNTLTGRLETALSGHFERLQSAFGELKTEVSSSKPDQTISNEGNQPSRSTRLRYAQGIRDIVVQKWLEGRELRPSPDDRNIYVFTATNESGNAYEINLRTPYRATIGQDGRMPFALDVWVDRYKKLNFEWDSDGNYALRGFKRDDGRWIEDLTYWNVTPNVDLTAETAAA